MESSKKMLVGLVVVLATFAVFTTFAGAALEHAQKDVITADAIRSVIKSSKLPADAINALAKSKTLVSRIDLEEAFLENNNDANHGQVSGFRIPCGESCVYIPCITSMIGCKCSNSVCYR